MEGLLFNLLGMIKHCKKKKKHVEFINLYTILTQ